MPVGILRATLVVAASATLAACAHSTPVSKELAMTATTASSSTVPIEPVKQWPLKFKRHSFSVFTYDTYGCKVIYARQVQVNQDPGKLQRSSASYGPDYQKNWSGVHGDIENFPPLEISWRSKDGQPHEARIDLGEVFKDELILHNVPREEMADVPHGKYQSQPAILVEVNDRTIRIYMRAFISTKHLQVPGNVYSNFRDDLILVKTYTY
jgi:hypothetical protein